MQEGAAPSTRRATIFNDNLRDARWTPAARRHASVARVEVETARREKSGGAS